MQRTGVGPCPAQVMVVGECFGVEDEQRGEPFMGTAGAELNKMLHEAGLLRSNIFVTNLVNARPYNNDISRWIPLKKKDVTPDMGWLRDRQVSPIVREGYERLQREIKAVNPNIIITTGNASLWALTGAWGALKWRGSQLQQNAESLLEVAPEGGWAKVIPILNPSAILSQWEMRSITLTDLRRAKKHALSKDHNHPKWNFIIRPSFQKVLEIINFLSELVEREPTRISLDLETRAGHIACCGLAWSNLDAISIPFMDVRDEYGYWSVDEEAVIINALYHLLTKKNALVDWQNGLYDAQYIYRHWHFVPNGVQDTMLSHHVAFAGQPKALDYQASMYCEDYVYWKDDGKTWAKNVGEDQLWGYNCVDCVRTHEIAEVEQGVIKQLGLEAVHEFQQKLFYPVLQAMQRGVRIDLEERKRLSKELAAELGKRELYFKEVLGHPLNPRSPVQMTKLFYGDLNQPPVMSRAKKNTPAHVTCDDTALAKIMLKEPLLRPIIHAIQEYRTIGVFRSTFVEAELDVDRRMRCSYNIAGTETYRFNSSENAFGSGTNLQNVPSGGEDADSALVLPNVRKLFIPDEGFEMFDTDLSKADLRVVAWESDENEMKSMLAEGRDPYIEAAREFHKDNSIKKNLPNGSADPRYKQFKAFAHGTHYLQSPNGLAQRQGMTVHSATKLQSWYFGKYPKIKSWQDEFKKQVASRRYVENKFGYRRYYFDRVNEDTFREAIAWVPQSTVAIYINKIWMRLYEECPQIWILMQVHDSLVGEFPIHLRDKCLADLERCSQIVVPYDDPLIIPTGVKTSTKSWGDCE